MLKKINLHLIRTDGGTQGRVTLDQETVNHYSELMKDGVVFPALNVYHDGSDYWLVDGFHRYFAHKAVGTSSLEVDITSGTLREAQLASKAVNKEHGLRKNAADYRKNVVEMLQDEEYSKWTNSDIARWVGVSDSTVGRIKASLEPETLPQTTVKEISRNGKKYEMDVANIGKEKELPVAQRPVGTKPDSSTVNEDKLAIAMMTDQLTELSDTVTQLSDENSKLKDAIAIGQWNASDIEKMDIEDTVKELREQVRVLEIENKSMREGRDMYQNRNAELMKTVKSLQAKLKKYEA